MVKKEKKTKGAQFFYNVAKILLITMWVSTGFALLVFKDFPNWLFRPIGWVFFIFGCLAVLGVLASKLGLNDEYQG